MSCIRRVRLFIRYHSDVVDTRLYGSESIPDSDLYSRIPISTECLVSKSDTNFDPCTRIPTTSDQIRDPTYSEIELAPTESVPESDPCHVESDYIVVAVRANRYLIIHSSGLGTDWLGPQHQYRTSVWIT